MEFCLERKLPTIEETEGDFLWRAEHEEDPDDVERDFLCPDDDLRTHDDDDDLEHPSTENDKDLESDSMSLWRILRIIN